IFLNYETHSASTLILGVTLFSFQVYGDFSGYSDIAIGTSKMFGMELMSNFKFPNFSRNVAEYWQRWHISLSTWFRHYVYIPLGGSRVSKLLSVRNICIIFLVSGFWHGANWTFIFWGGFHALAYIPVFLMGRNTLYKDNVVGENTFFPTLTELGQVLLTFGIVTFSRIFFRSESITDSFQFINRLFTEFHYEPYVQPNGYRLIDYFILLAGFVLYEYRIRKDERTPFKFKSKAVRFIAYTLVIFTMLLFYDSGFDRSFIYFQFYQVMIKLVKNLVVYSVLILIALEVLVRVFHLYNDMPERYVDSKNINKWIPGQTGYAVYGNRVQNMAEYHINESGYNSYRKFDPTEEKFEVALIGDSYIEGFHQNYYSSIGKRIEEEFPGIEVYEYGHSSNDMADQLYLVHQNPEHFDKIDKIIFYIKFENDLERNEYGHIVRQPQFMMLRKSKLLEYAINIGLLDSVRELMAKIRNRGQERQSQKTSEPLSETE